MFEASQLPPNNGHLFQGYHEAKTPGPFGNLELHLKDVESSPTPKRGSWPFNPLDL
jgi:hypothetical protein